MIQFFRCIRKKLLAENKLTHYIPAGTSSFSTDYTDLLRDRQLSNDYTNRNWQIDDLLLSLEEIENVTSELILIIEEELAKRFRQ